MKIKSVLWNLRSRLLEVCYEDGLKGSMEVPADWGEFRGAMNSDQVVTTLMWERADIHPYTIYIKIKENADGQANLRDWKPRGSSETAGHL